MTKQQKKQRLINSYNAFIRLFFAYLAERYGVKTADEFKEAEHPRDKDGKFTKTKGNSDWGEAFTEFSNKPKEAIKHLLSVKRGYVPNAFYREGLGGIDLIWGGSRKTVYRRRLWACPYNKKTDGTEIRC